MNDPVVRFFVGVFVALNVLLTPLALNLGFEEAPWTQVVLLTPAIAALLTGLRYRLPFSDLGMGLGKPAYLLGGFVAVAAYVILTLLVGNMLELSEFAPGWDLGAFAGAMLTQGLALESLLWAFGEELGWRGLLSERLRRSQSPRSALLIVWILWFGWHLAPLVAFGAGSVELLSFALLLFALTALLNGLRSRSGSLWPAVIAHAGHNQLAESLTSRATAPLTEGSWAGELGPGTAIMAALVVVGIHSLWRMGSDTSERPPETC